MENEAVRIAHAEQAFLFYDFGEEVRGGGWEHLEGGDYWIRGITFNSGVKMRFVVRFERDSSEVKDAYVE